MTIYAKSAVLLAASVSFFAASAFAEKVKVCVGDFPPYELGSEFLSKNPNDYEVTRESVVVCMRRFTAGFFDVAMIDTMGFATAQAAKNSKIVGLVDYSDGVDALVVQKGKEKEPIKGTTWGVSFEAASPFFLGQYLLKNNLTFNDIKVQDMKLENSKNFMTNKRIHGIVSWEPFVTESVTAGGTVVYTSKDAPKKLYDMVVMSNKISAAKKPLVAKYVSARLKEAEQLPNFLKFYGTLKKKSAADSAADLEGLYLFKGAADVASKKADLISSLNEAQATLEAVAPLTKAKVVKQKFEASLYEADMFGK